MSNEKPETNPESRRHFMMKLSLSMGGLAAIAVSIPVVGALLAPLLNNQKEVWRKVGVLDDFPIGSTTLIHFENADPKAWAGTTARTAAWLRRESVNYFIAFSANCTHLGCPVRWEEKARLFMCPCHGGVYYHDGTVAAGPPPKALTQHAIRLVKSEVFILTAPLPITNFGDKQAT